MKEELNKAEFDKLLPGLVSDEVLYLLPERARQAFLYDILNGVIEKCKEKATAAAVLQEKYIKGYNLI